MKLTQLEYFCVAARYHNITKAAKELFVTQPSISNAIRALEEEFGVNLFFRNNNKLTLTPEGELFYKSALNVNIKFDIFSCFYRFAILHNT